MYCCVFRKWKMENMTSSEKVAKYESGAPYRNRLRCANISFFTQLCRFDECKHERFNDIKDLQIW